MAKYVISVSVIRDGRRSKFMNFVCDANSVRGALMQAATTKLSFWKIQNEQKDT